LGGREHAEGKRDLKMLAPLGEPSGTKTLLTKLEDP